MGMDRSQLIYHLAKAEILILPQNAVDEVWNCFNLRYGYGNQVWENPTRYAVFKASYDRVAIDGVHYVGNREFEHISHFVYLEGS